MNEKIIATIDLTKIDKSRIVERKYVNKDGVEVVEKNYTFEISPLKETKKIKDGATWEMWKTHSISESKTKQERENKVPTKFMGSGIVFKTKAPVVEETVNPDDIPNF